jgi:AcrR family transcriptional regulator
MPVHAGRRDLNRKRTQHALASAALRLVAEHSFDHVTVEMIADAAEVSPRTFSNYFAGKEHAILWMDPEPASHFAAAFAAQPDELPLLATLRAVLVMVAGSIAEQTETTELRMKIVQAEPRLLPAFHARFALVEDTVTACIAQRLDVDAEHDRRPRLLAGLLGNIVRSSLEHCRSHDPLAHLPDVVAEGFDLLIATITCEDTHHARSL